MSPSSRLARVVVPRALLGVAIVGALVWPAISTADDLKLPKGVDREAAEHMYAEQLDSQSSIEDLVAGRVKSIVVTDRYVTADEAELKLRVTENRTGAVSLGTMKLVKADGKWYFASIGCLDQTAEAVSPVDGYDVGVLNTILAEQTENAATTAKLVDGTLDTIRIGKPEAGYRSVVLPVTFKGKGKPTNGEITAVELEKDGAEQWFVVSFDEK